MPAPTLTDYLTGEPIRPATREEWQRSADAARTGDRTGAFTLDGRAVFVTGDFPTTGHTPEPWRVETPYTSVGSDDVFAFTTNIIALHPSTARANAARIVACVNACAGLDDPAEAIREVRAALTDARDRLAGMTGVPNPLPRVRAALAILDGGPK